MTAITFPPDPEPDEIFSAAGRNWQWSEDLQVWQALPSGPPPVTDIDPYPQIFNLMGA